MKYGGTITILDDQGETVFERELTADEMIDEILRGKQFSAVEVVEGPERTDVTVTLPPPVAPAPRAKGQKLCKACGQPGHMQKTCPQALEAAGHAAHAASAMADVVEERGGDRDVVNMSPMSKTQFEDLKEFQLDEKSAEDISQEIGWDDLDDIEVALKSNSYLSYTFDRKKVLAKRMRKG